MTEADWLMSGSRPEALLRYARGGISGRKVQLIACGACRLVWDHIDHPQLRAAVEAAERFADGGGTDDEYTAAVRAARAALGWEHGGGVVRVPPLGRGHDPMSSARWAAAAATLYELPQGAEWAIDQAVQAAGRAVARPLCDLIRELVGNPYQPWKAVPPFLGGGLVQPDGQTVRVTDTARGLAEAVHAGQAFDRLPVLADALEEGGLTDPELLAHLRRDGGHARGCWALDVALGKT